MVRKYCNGCKSQASNKHHYETNASEFTASIENTFLTDFFLKPVFPFESLSPWTQK
jgi:hypothetical protein